MVMRACVHEILVHARGTETDNLIHILMAFEPYLLHMEVEAGDDDTINLLLIHGSDPNARNDNGQTPLSLAAIHG
jgi:ankyrin repeat protein